MQKMQQITKRFISIVAVGVMSATGMTVAMAQKVANEPLQVKLVRSKIVLESGREVAQSAAIATPGDILEEVATYTNLSKAPLNRVEATLPIPVSTELVMASIKPANAKASIDGKNFSKIPLTRKVRQANGVELEQPVPLSEYRYLRWYPGELAPDKPMSFSARFKVENGSIATSNTVK